MSSPSHLSYYNFSLPKENIAVSPADPRDNSKLVYGHAGKTVYRHFTDLSDLLPSHALIIINDSKVLQAELHARTPTNASIHLNVHRKADDGVSWYAFAAPAKKCSVGMILRLSDETSLMVTGKNEGELCLQPVGDGLAFPEIFRRFGTMPLPPYIRKRREAMGLSANQAHDVDHYQTMYADQEGSVAAPTAGLHFTNRVMDKLKERNIEVARVTLHTGAGTFLPVKTSNIDAHVMHGEHYDVPDSTVKAIRNAKSEGRPVVATGTTALRTLESCYDKSKGTVISGEGYTEIFIRPGYRFNVVDGLITNFHLPESTLFMLVCAFSGAPFMKSLYQDAISRNCRFFSYGDACLLTRPDTTHMFPYAD